MTLPKNIKIRDKKLPATPGVYLFKNKKGKVVYVGKATNLKSRVNSYFRGRTTHSREILRSADASLRMTAGGWRTIDEMLHEVARIDYQVTDSVIEALILEANLIKKYMPAYNVKEKDDKSFWYVVVTKEQWPKVMLVRGNELAQFRHLEPRRKVGVRDLYTLQGKRFLHSPRGSVEMTDGVWKVFGPYTSASSIRAALDLIRKWFPWSDCQSNRTAKQQDNRRACFDYHIGRCPGVCIGAVARKEYMKNIRNVILMLEGKKARVFKNVEREMKHAAREEKFEAAEKLRRKLFALQHIRDIAVITREDRHPEHSEGSRGSKNGILRSPRGSPIRTEGGVIKILGRIEGYDISNISGTNAVGSMVVFNNGEPAKSEYRKFRIKTVQGINDVAMMREVLERRFAHSIGVASESSRRRILSAATPRERWELPDLIVIDGGWGQVNVAREVVDNWARTVLHQQRTVLASIPIVGIAKGFDRKQDVPIFEKNNPELIRVVQNYKDLLLRVRDEAHRFAVVYHRKLRGARHLT